MKTCNKCKKTKELIEFNKKKTNKDGYRSDCRECNLEMNKLYRENNKEKIAERDKLYYENNKEKVAEREKLYRENNKEKVAERKKLYYENNKEKVAERKKLYYENNKEKVAEREKLYRENNKEKIAERRKLYRENNKEKVAEREKLYYENNKEKIAERKKLYRENNKEKGLLKGARSRAKEKGLPFSITEEDIVIPEICPVLGIPLFIGEGKTVDNSPNLDRIIPEKGYVPDNIRVISAKANRIKTNATAEEIKLVWEDLQKFEKGLL